MSSDKQKTSRNTYIPKTGPPFYVVLDELEQTVKPIK
jgi:hypothetical protein